MPYSLMLSPWYLIPSFYSLNSIFFPLLTFFNINSKKRAYFCFCKTSALKTSFDGDWQINETPAKVFIQYFFLSFQLLITISNFEMQYKYLFYSCGFNTKTR